MHFFVAKLLSTAVMTYPYDYVGQMEANCLYLELRGEFSPCRGFVNY